MKVKLFTHSDLDGLGCIVVAKRTFDKLDYKINEYGDINENVLDFLENDKPTDYDLILITDISVNEDVAEKLDLIHRGNVAKVQLLDHHNTASWLNKYEWAHVQSAYEEDGEKRLTCGTSLLLEYLAREHYIGILDWNDLIDFVEKVRRYDTWEWNNIYDDIHAKQLNNLLFLIGTSKFLHRFTHDPNIEFTETEETLLSVEEAKIQSYLDKKLKQVKIHKVLDYDRVAVVFADQYTSELGNYIARQIDVDFVAMIDMATGKVSYRGIKQDVDLGQVAKLFGGGGHPMASGSTYKHIESLKDDVVKELFYY